MEEDSEEDLKEELIEKHATIEAIQLCDVNIIPFQFFQLFTNLISNSLKFSRECFIIPSVKPSAIINISS